MDANSWLALFRDANSWLALFTFLLALATTYLVWETRKSRVQQDRQRKEVAFRAALLELADNIVHFSRWNPMRGSIPDDIWRGHRLEFTRLTELLEAIWIDQQLWERITGGLLINIKRAEESVYGALSNDVRSNTVNTMNFYYYIDLYLKQLVRYISCEMRRQKLTLPLEVRNMRIFQPQPYSHGDPSRPPELENQLQGPFVMLPPEPDDPIFRECRREVLIQEARQALERVHETVIAQLNS